MFILPIGIANMMPVLMAKVPYLNFLHRFPIDSGAKLGKDRLFGKGKTWGGFFWAVVGGAMVSILELPLSAFFEISNLNFLLYFNSILAIGAICGDLLKSFFKRRMAINSGSSWPILDQIDFVIGAYLLALISGLIIQTEVFLITLVIIPPLHLLANVCAYFLGLKKVWW